MRRFRSLALLFFCLFAAAFARHDGTGACGTSREGGNGRLFLHRQALRGRAARPLAATAPAPAAPSRDIGDLALIDAVDGVISRVNQFNLDGKTLSFAPASADASSYRYSVVDGGFDSGAASAGAPLAGLGDDDSRDAALPFSFPFYGASYGRLFINSDGNLTFTAADNASSSRSVARLNAGPPRIAPLFDDLDPSRAPGGMRVFSQPDRFVVSWVAVPEYSGNAGGHAETFQARLYPDGRIEFSYSGVQPDIENAVTGISPGNLAGPAALVDFRNDASGQYSTAVAEWFAGGLSVDVVAAAQRFYETHEDAYDYLVIYNTLGIPAMGDALAYEDTLRSFGAGYGVEPQDTGRQYGSASRLKAVMNMGRLDQYPAEPRKAEILGRPGDTALSILAHEAGHLFLAFASVSDDGNPSVQPMLGYQGSHWSFYFNSDASFMEGERIFDNGAGAPAGRRFVTGGTVEQYAPLDQYLMGFRAPQDVPPVFVVREPTSTISPNAHPPYTSARFDGRRQDIGVDDVQRAMGRRTPDHTVAQRRYRFAFAVIVPQGEQPTAAQLAQVEGYRQSFPEYFAEASGGNGAAETTLRRSMKLSLYPAAGIVEGTSTTAVLTLRTPPDADLQIALSAPKGNASVPASVTLRAGATVASFTVRGVRSGVEEVMAAPPAPYEIASARIQVAAGAESSILRLVAVAGERQVTPASGPLPEPIVVRLTDTNNLDYAGATIVATASPGGRVESAEILTDARGQAAFRWTPGPASSSQLRLELKNAPAVFVTINGGSAAPVIQSVQNAASFTDGIAAGALETIWGVNLAGGRISQATTTWPLELGGVQALLNGVPAPLLYASDNQINFYVPAGTAAGPGTLEIVTPSGARAMTAVNVAAAQPGIFSRAILRSGTAERADESPSAAGDYIEIYCTGLGPTYASGQYQKTVDTPTVFVGAAPAVVQYSGLAPGYVGLYQINARIPEGLASGMQPVMISLHQMRSNVVNIAVR